MFCVVICLVVCLIRWMVLLFSLGFMGVVCHVGYCYCEYVFLLCDLVVDFCCIVFLLEWVCEFMFCVKVFCNVVNVLEIMFVGDVVG